MAFRWLSVLQLHSLPGQARAASIGDMLGEMTAAHRATKARESVLSGGCGGRQDGR